VGNNGSDVRECKLLVPVFFPREEILVSSFEKGERRKAHASLEHFLILFEAFSEPPTFVPSRES